MIIVPNLDQFVRDSTDLGPIRALIKCLRRLNLPQLLRLTWYQLPYLMQLVRHDFTAAVILLTDIELIPQSHLTSVSLNPTLTDLSLALGNQRLLTTFLTHIHRHYSPKAGLATNNLSQLIKTLGQWRINRHFSSVQIASKPSSSLIFFP